ncbi:GNAT family N-acetyltransferase [Actinacidiphila glaucinigra]
MQGTIEQEDPEVLGMYLAEPSLANRFGTGLVAEVDGRVVGVVAGAGVHLPISGLQVSADEIAQRIGLLDVLAVDSDHRRLGIGALLCDSLLTSFQDRGYRLMLTKLAAGRHDLVPLYSGWGWNVGEVGAGVAVEIGPHQLVIAEDPAARTAWARLSAKVRLTPSIVPNISVVSGMFD